jgi:hypothetical protein
MAGAFFLLSGLPGTVGGGGEQAVGGQDPGNGHSCVVLFDGGALLGAGAGVSWSGSARTFAQGVLGTRLGEADAGL